MTEVASLTGQLLVAAPVLTDPNFARSVVYVLDHDGDGSMGVVLNRPSGIGVAEVLEPWAELAGRPPVVFEGGPMALDSALALAAVPGGAEPLGWRRVHGTIGLVDLDAPPEVLAADLGGLRVFVGYAGWSPGQLEEELAEGAWYVLESEPGDAFSPDPGRLWRTVLRRQRSELAMVATYPDDPSMN